MRFGANSLLWTANFGEEHLNLLPKVKAMGFDGFEVARFAFDGFPAAKIKAALADEGLGCTFCSALTGQTSLVSDDPAVRTQARDFLVQGIEAAAELGSKVFMGPFCSPVGLLVGRRRNEDEWKRAVEGMQSLEETLEACDVTLMMEPLNRFETYFLNTMADGRKLCEEVGHDRIAILFDTFHANIEEKNLAESLRGLGKYVKHMHTCENDRGVPGTGHIDWVGVFAALRDLEYDGWVMIESFGLHVKEIAAAACIWRDIAPSSDAIAEDGVKFLRKMAEA
jgi:D-psicose/D-tagatose/L-ribulose 3-epimerase